MAPTIELLQGTLDVLILKAISLGPLHRGLGWCCRPRPEMSEIRTEG